MLDLKHVDPLMYIVVMRSLESYSNLTKEKGKGRERERERVIGFNL